ncbi:AAA family ATPase [Microseira sp. BLCC-F43]|uniref:AAA family ATPase n=1 Tax=Microseira sp. BLCC-F43 TaxID=3153602 RepID=UPI0035BB0B7D
MFESHPNLTAEDILKNLKTTDECPWLEVYFPELQKHGEIDVSLLLTEPDDDDDLVSCVDGLNEVTTEIEWTIQDVLPTGYAVILTGKPGCGKSLSAFDMAAAIACGTVWNAKQCKQGKVLILNNDQPEDVLKRLLKIRLGEDMELRSQVFFKHGWVADEKGLEKLRKWEKKYGFYLVIMDSVRECICTPLGLSENTPETGHKLKEVARIVTDNRSCFIAIHHDKKGDGDGIDKAAGHNSLTSPLDAHWRITRGVTGCLLSMPKTRGYNPIEINYQIDFPTGICHVVEGQQSSVTGNSNNPTLGERVVTYLSESDSQDGATRKELAEALAVKENSLKVILQRLMADGTVESVENPLNPKAKAVSADRR